MPESAQSGGGELVQSVPSHLVPLAPDIEDHRTWKKGRFEKITFLLELETSQFIFIFACFVIFNLSSPPRNLFATMRKGEGGWSGTSGGPGVNGSPIT